MRAVYFIVLMFVASVVYVYGAATALLPNAVGLSDRLHFIVLFILPAVLIIAAGYAAGVWRNVDAIVRLIGLSALGAVLPGLAIYGSIIFMCAVMSECF